MKLPLTRQRKAAASLTPRVQQLLADFGKQPGVTSEHIDKFRSVITSSPSLNKQLDTAAQQGDLLSFGVMDAGVHAGAQYDPADNARRIELPLQMLTPENEAEAAFVLAHETQHALNRAQTGQATAAFHSAVRTQAKPTGSGDYTEPINRLIEANRRDEASANLAGWNSLVEHVRHRNPKATLRHIADVHPGRTQDFVEWHGPMGDVRPKPNLNLRLDLMVDLDDHNIEGMGQNFFDKADDLTRLGQAGRASYPNYYGAWAIGVAAQYQRHYQPVQPGIPERPLMINLSRLKLDPYRMEGSGLDLGPSQQPMPFLDTSVTPARPGVFHHTKKNPNATPVPARTDRTVKLTRAAGPSDRRWPELSSEDAPDRSGAEELSPGLP